VVRQFLMAILVGKEAAGSRALIGKRHFSAFGQVTI
jgi:hypothetical protein